MIIYIAANGSFIATDDPRYEREFNYSEKIEVPDDYIIPANSIPKITDGKLTWKEIEEVKTPDMIENNSYVKLLKAEIDAI